MGKTRRLYAGNLTGQVTSCSGITTHPKDLQSRRAVAANLYFRSPCLRVLKGELGWMCCRSIPTSIGSIDVGGESWRLFAVACVPWTLGPPYVVVRLVPGRCRKNTRWFVSTVPGEIRRRPHRRCVSGHGCVHLYSAAAVELTCSGVPGLSGSFGPARTSYRAKPVV